MKKGLLIGTYAAMLGIANIAAVKVVSVGSWEFTAGVVPIAVAYLASDIGVERYGKQFGHKLVWAGTSALILVIIVTQIVLFLPGGGVVNDVFGASLPILIASVVTVVVAQHTDVWLFTAIKRKFPYRPTRNIGSTTLSQLLDTALFTVLAFSILPVVVGGVRLPVATMISIILSEWVVKTGIAIVDTPLFIASTNESA